MSAASSGETTGPGEQWPKLGTTTSEFGALTYLQLASKDENNPIRSDPFIVGKSVETAAGGSIVGASTEAQGTRYTLKVRSQVQIDKLLKLSTLLDGTEVVVTPHPNLNTSRCVISCFEMIHMEEKDILRNLIGQGVIRVQRISRKEHGQTVNTSALILTFNKSNYPLHVKVGVLRTNTRPYYPNPLLCYSCFRYGHPRTRCPGPKRCFNCSGIHELNENQECTAAAFCINCNGPHRPNNRQCLVYKKEVDIVHLKVNNNITYNEARKRIESGNANYAAAAAQQTEDRKKLEELEKNMFEKDKQIAKLLDIVKNKDEKIDKLLKHIKQIQTSEMQQSQLYSQNKQSSSTESTQVVNKKTRQSQIIGNSMQLRNRSPISTEPTNVNNERNKKKKRHNRSNNSSPSRQSPPLKKITENIFSSDQEAISVNEDEI